MHVSKSKLAAGRLTLTQAEGAGLLGFGKKNNKCGSDLFREDSYMYI